jgi:ethanolamine utilization cobalamin adenosyltransferase
MSEKNKEYDVGEIEIEITPEMEEFLRGRDIDKKYQKQHATGIIDPTLKKPELSSDKFLADDGFEVSEKVREKINAHLEALGDKEVFKPNRNMGLKK